jgi:SOS-response transcriptional repressor LexA
MNPHGMTPRQLQLMVFVQNYAAEHGYSPNFQEIATGIGLKAKSRVHYLVASLAERGHCRLLPGRSRSLVLTETGHLIAVRFANRSVPRATSGVAA